MSPITVGSFILAQAQPTSLTQESGGATPQFKQFVSDMRPMKRMGSVEDVANCAEYLASELSAFVSGQHLLLSGGAPS